MAVDQAPISIDPYKSQVPLVQIPQEDLQRAQPLPTEAGYMGKAGAGLAIGDSLMKGVLKGLQMKEEKKYKQATATMNALDTTTQSSYENYQTLLAQGKQDEAKAAYDVYLKNFNDAKTAKAQFAIPEKQPKGQKGQKGKKDENGVAAQGGFGAGLKQFFERNPHVIPELALVAMQPKPPGPSVETLQNQAVIKQNQQAAEVGDIKLQEAKKKQAAEDTYSAGVPTFQGLSSEQVAALPPDVKKNYDAWQSAKAYLTPMKHSMAMATYKMPDGTFQRGYADDPPADGELYVPGATPKIGTEQDFTANALKGYGVTEKTPPAQKAALEKYAHDMWQWKQSQTTTGAHEVLQPDPVTHKMVAVQVGSSTTKGAPQPKPPAGFAPLGEDGMPQQGGMNAPPQQAAPRTMATPNPKGLVEPGNISIDNRPTVQNADNSHSSEFSVSFEQDGKEVLVPTVVNGKFLTPDGKKPKPGSPEEKAMFKAAWDNYLKTGQHLGKFANVADANAYAKVLHNRGESGGRGRMTPPPTASAAPKTAGRGAMTPPPTGVKGLRNTGLDSMAADTNTQKVEADKAAGYAKAETAYKAALQKNQKMFEDRLKSLQKAGALTADVKKAQETWLQGENDKATAALEQAKAEVGKLYAQKVHAVGGTVEGEQRPTKTYMGHTYEQDPHSKQWILKAGQ